MSQSMSPFIQMFLSMMVSQVPMLIASLLGLAVVVSRWRQASRGAAWAAIGFALSAILCLAIPLLQSAVQQWVMQSGEVAHRAWVFTSLALLWSTLRGATYVMLLVAIFAGRPLPEGTRV